MFRVFIRRVKNSAFQTYVNSLQQPTTVSSAQREKGSDDALNEALAILSKSNGLAVIQHGARLAVVSELLVSILTHLPQPMRADIVRSFRGRIEDLMSLSDDRSLPEKYHTALLTEVNRYLNALK